MIRYFVIVDGQVQGVGFRFFAQSCAIKHSLTGFVRNMDNGMVELEIQGAEENVNKFLSTIRRGNTFIKVDDFSIKKIDIILGEKKFKVTY
ncbi:acylphosphatase [Clostridium paraputrificum]|uniref:acylphosphatase n=1 Tax=Clostridium TaxID=1485 RepID=UPI003D331E0F